MNDTGVFKYIWRLNALIILAVGIFLLVMLVGERTGDKQRRANFLEAQEEREAEQELPLALADPHRIGDSGIMLIPLTPGGMPGGDKWTHRPAPVHNMLFIDETTNESWWLFEDDGPVILEWFEIGAESGQYSDTETVGILYHTVDSDTDGDGKVGQGDRITLQLSDLDGRDMRTLITGLVSLNYTSVSGQKLFCLFDAGEGLTSAVFDLGGARESLDRAVLPTAPPIKADAR